MKRIVLGLLIINMVVGVVHAAEKTIAVADTSSLTALSQGLLKTKAEFLLIRLTDDTSMLDWIQKQATTPDSGKKIQETQADNTRRLPDISQQAAKGILQPFFSTGQQKDLLEKYLKDVNAERVKVEEWVADGQLVAGQPHDFAKNVYTTPESATKTYIEKVFVSPDEKLICMGDLHGSLHSLLRNLWHMVECGQLDDTFTLAPNHRLIFLGDIVDRGLYGVEVIALLLLLKSRNWNRVHFARGNHEDVADGNKWLAENYGFFKEVTLKHPDASAELIGLYKKFFLSMPQSLFIGVGDVSFRWWMQCAHGGIDPFVDVKKFIDKDGVAGNKDKQYGWIASLEKDVAQKPKQWQVGEGFNWSDVTGMPSEIFGIKGQANYCQGASTFVGGVWQRNPERGLGVSASIEQINTYLENNDLELLFRGHQDDRYSFKVLKANEAKPQTWRLHHRFIEATPVYSPERLFKEGFKPFELFERDGDNSAPCFTCTTAGEGKANLNDGYAMIELSESYENTVIKVYENHLSLPLAKSLTGEMIDSSTDEIKDADNYPLRPGRFGKFMTIAPRHEKYEDPVAAATRVAIEAAAQTSMHRWVETPDHNPIDPVLIQKAKKLFTPRSGSAASLASSDATASDIEASETATTPRSAVSVAATK